MEAEALRPLTDGGVLETEAGGAALRVTGVQVEEAQFTPEQNPTEQTPGQRSRLTHQPFTLHTS